MDYGHSLVQAIWSLSGAWETGDITAIAERIAREHGHSDWQQVRDDIANALDDLSDESSGRIGHDARGIYTLPTGERIAWWATNAYTHWMPLDLCDADQLADLGKSPAAV